MENIKKKQILRLKNMTNEFNQNSINSRLEYVGENQYARRQTN